MITTPLPVLPLVPTVRAATGDLIWVDFSGTQYLSSDGGATWERFIQEDDFFAVAAGAGAFGYYGGTDGIDDANSFYPGTDTRVVALKGWGETWHAVAVGSLRTLSDRQKIASRDKSPVTVHYWKLPRSVRHKSKTHSYAFTADSKYLVRITHPKSGSTDYATVVKASTGRTVARRKLVRSSRHLVGGASVYSLVASKSGLSVCRKPIPSGARTCTLVAAGDHRGSSATFFQQGRFSLVRDPAAATPLLVDGDRVTAVTLPASAVSWKIDGVGDPTRPLVRVVDEAGETTHLRVLADGATEEYLGDVPGTSLWTTGVALSPDTLLFSGAGQVWTQAVFASGLGDRVRHDWVQVVGASAGRWLIGQGEQSYSAVAWTVDAGEPVAELPGDAATWRISGPYVYRPGKEVRTVLGKQIDDVVPLAMFGSLVVEQVSAPAASGYEVRVRDLADADLDPVTVTLPTTGVLTSEVQLWGDWIGVTDAGVDAADPADNEVVLHNWVTGATRTLQARAVKLVRFGDGLAVLTKIVNGDRTDLVWNFDSGDETELGEVYDDLVALDGDRVAYVLQAVGSQPSSELTLQTFAGAGGSAPRLLGVVTGGEASVASPWTVQLDLSKAVVAGSVVIRSAEGDVVRRIATDAAPDGSIRGVSWDGVDADGHPVDAGDYTWELEAEASDGSGAAVGVRGVQPAGGTIAVN